MIYYLAYGPNTNPETFLADCPTAREIGCTTLKGRVLRFYGPRGKALATAAEGRSSELPVVVWALPSALPCPAPYREARLRVKLSGKTISAVMHILNVDGWPLGLPSRFLFDTIRSGYELHGFDTEQLRAALLE